MKDQFEPSYIFVFDIETIPDDEAAIPLLGGNLPNIEAKREALTNYHLALTDGKNSFLRQPFHKVVAISFLVAKITKNYHNQEEYLLKEIRSGGTLQSTEEDLIKGFFQTVNKLKPRIISFNGRTFDIPVLKYRAMKYGISGELYHTLGNKYENYNHRYATGWHCDLLDALSDFGASARVKLNEVCAIFGYPGKIGVDGSKVTTMYDNKELKGIRDYCETDVLNTYLVYLRYILHIEKISKAEYNKNIQDVITFLENHSNKAHFQEFLTMWHTASNGKLFL
ncbi:3'-5' exonuclease [Candidatus Hepatincola sp. Pdp]